MKRFIPASAALAASLSLSLTHVPAAVAWEPTKNVEFIIPAGTGGGAVATQLVGGHVDSTVNNPIEAVAQWRGGNLRPLCVFEQKRMPYKEKVTDKMSWADIPTCKEAGLDVEYMMLRGVFTAPGVKPDQVEYYIDLFKKVMATPEWQKLMEEGAFNRTALVGKSYADWVAKEEQRHRELMKAAGFLAGQ